MTSVGAHILKVDISTQDEFKRNIFTTRTKTMAGACLPTEVSFQLQKSATTPIISPFVPNPLSTQFLGHVACQRVAPKRRSYVVAFELDKGKDAVSYDSA